MVAIESREQAQRMAMRTPCCAAPYVVSYEYEGRPFLQEQVVEAYECTGCDNTWFADGSPWMIWSTSPDDTGCRQMHTFEMGES